MADDMKFRRCQRMTGAWAIWGGGFRFHTWTAPVLSRQELERQVDRLERELERSTDELDQAQEWADEMVESAVRKVLENRALRGQLKASKDLVRYLEGELERAGQQILQVRGWNRSADPYFLLGGLLGILIAYLSFVFGGWVL